jgi:hypothetical protein
MIDPNLDNLPPKESWRWGLILNTNEKNYRFMFCDKALFDNFMFAFTCIYRSDTNKPLYEFQKKEVYYGDLTPYTNQQALKTQPDLPNIIQTEIQEPGSSSQFDVNTGHPDINNLRSEQNLSREEERINHDSNVGMNTVSNTQQIHQEKPEQKKEHIEEKPVLQPITKTTRRNSFFDNSNPVQSTLTNIGSTASSSGTTTKDPSIPKPPKVTKSKPKEEPQEEMKRPVVFKNLKVLFFRKRSLSS